MFAWPQLYLAPPAFRLSKAFLPWPFSCWWLHISSLRCMMPPSFAVDCARHPHTAEAPLTRSSKGHQWSAWLVIATSTYGVEACGWFWYDQRATYNHSELVTNIAREKIHVFISLFKKEISRYLLFWCIHSGNSVSFVKNLRSNQFSSYENKEWESHTQGMVVGVWTWQKKKSLTLPNNVK